MIRTTNQRQYRPREFARRAGVTVRALHHYDRLGLLKPSSRTAAGYRLYSASDFGRLQQIITLKFIGFSLREIRRLLAGAELGSALRLQRRTLEQKRRQLETAIAAIAQAEQRLRERKASKWQAFAKIIEEIQMQANTDWTKQYYNEEAQKLLAERGKLWSPELQEQTNAKWAVLLKDIEHAAQDQVEPASQAGLALAERHAELIRAFTGGSTAIGQGLAALWEDRASWPAGFRRQVFAPLAAQGVRAAQSDQPSFLSEPGRKFLEQALKARGKHKPCS